MSKDKISDYSATAASNTDIGGVNIQGSAPAANIDNALREQMSHLADMNAGTFPLHDTVTFADPTDTTKRVRLDAVGVTTGNTRVLTVPDANGTIHLSGTNQPDTATFSDSVDATKKVRLDAGNVTTATTRVLSSPDVDGTIYVAGNIIGGVGTATQSAGVPTGVIIEKVIGGGDGDYVRFADGTQICTWADAGLGTNVATGSMWESATTPTWTFPAAFSSATNLAISGSAGATARWVTFAVPTTTSVTYQQKNSVSSGASQTTRLMAIGRWF